VTGTSLQQLTSDAGNFASNAFVFTNDATTRSALIRLAPLQSAG
jgi:hypothetical protein